MCVCVCVCGGWGGMEGGRITIVLPLSIIVYVPRCLIKVINMFTVFENNNLFFYSIDAIGFVGL